MIVAACKAVGLHHYIMSLPDGYDTILDDKASLSQGQKQLKNEGLDFSHTQQLPGTDYTIAGMVASQCIHNVKPQRVGWRQRARKGTT